VRDLGAADFGVREQARRELLAIGEPARPALERTMKESEDMEARWRAEQILRRLDNEQARPMDPAPRPAPRPVAPPREGTAPGGPPPGFPPLPELEEGFTPAERLFEDIMRRMEELGMGDPFVGPDKAVLEAPGLMLVVSTFSIFPRVHLRVEGHARPYVGRTLEDLLQRYPDLAEHAGMAELKEKWKEHLAQRRSPFGGQPGASPFGSFFEFRSQGVQITQGPDGVRVRVVGKDDQGNPTVQEYEGESIAEILKAHPELEGRIGGIRLELRAPSPRFFGRPGGQRLPLPPAPRPPVVTPREPATAVFGAIVEPPEPMLAAHLGIPVGRGALVRQVQPESQAAEIGLKRYDVVLEIDGAPVEDVTLLAKTLRQKAATREPLTLTVIRRGERVALSR
jgi:hypothetical protein